MRAVNSFLYLARCLDARIGIGFAVFVLLAVLESVAIVVALLNLWLWPLILAAIVCALHRLYVLWLLGKVRASVSRALLDRLLCQGLDVYLKQGPTVQADQMAVAVDQIRDGLILPILRGVSGLVRLAALVFLLFRFGAYQGIRNGLVLVLVHLLIGFVVTPYLGFFSVQSVRWARRSSRRLVDTLASFQDVLLSGSQSFFVSSYEEEVRELSRYEWIGSALLCAPLFLTVVTAIVLIFIFPWTSESSSLGLLPGWLMGTFAFIALAWVLNDLFLASLRFQNALSVLESLACLTQVRKSVVSASLQLPAELPLPLNRRIRLDDVSYRYPGRSDFALKGISVVIPVGARVALVGPSGSGKTTAARILLGLLRPTSGCIEVDGAAISDEEITRWRSNCAFVPKNLPLLNASIRDNVAFGCEDWTVDDAAVWAALEATSLADDILGLPYGLMTRVGSNGFQLSGWQVQRLALARAFYRNADLLVIDEPVNALDAPKGASAPEVLDIVARRCTTVVITHRMSTVARCDCVFELDRGRVRAFGAHHQLLKSSSTFANMFNTGPADV